MDAGETFKRTLLVLALLSMLVVIVLDVGCFAPSFRQAHQQFCSRPPSSMLLPGPPDQ